MSITRSIRTHLRVHHSEVQLLRVVIQNNHGQKLVGILHEMGSKELVILCHGFQSSKERIPMVNLAAALETKGISAFRFDFAGNGPVMVAMEVTSTYTDRPNLRSTFHFEDWETEP